MQGDFMVQMVDESWRGFSGGLFCLGIIWFLGSLMCRAVDVT